MSGSLHRLFFTLAFSAMGWLALGSALQIFAAAASNQTIDITVCTGLGVKKMAQPAGGDEEKPAAMKHCGKVPFAKFFAPPPQPARLQFEPPETVTSWPFIKLSDVLENQPWNSGAPPPGRAPPAG